MTGHLDGRVALITGAANGIGAATAERFAASGASVVLGDLDLASAEEVVARIGAAGGTARAAACDVTKREDVDEAVAVCAEEFGPIDLLVTCAGVIRDNLVHRIDEPDWDIVIDTHLKGTFLCAQAAQASMVPQQRGAMVFFSSASARGNRGQANYAAAKAASKASAGPLPSSSAGSGSG